MHELSLAHELVTIIERVAREHNAVRVNSALLELGAMTHVEPETLRFGFEVVCRDTLAAGCELTFRHVSLSIRCPHCDYQGAPDEERGGCRRCGGGGVEVVAGREIRLVHIDVEDEEDARDRGRQ